MSAYRGPAARHRQWRQRLSLLLVAVIAALSLGVGYHLGQRSAYGEMGIDPAAYRSMLLDLSTAQLELELLSDELAVQRARNEVDREALEMLRRQIATQKNQVAQVEEQLRFYKGIMVPDDGGRGLSLRPIELVALDEDRRYACRIVVQQEARQHDLLKGKLVVEVFGEQFEQQVSYPLSALSETIDDGALALRFRYFQAIEGELSLPEGFEPAGISLIATATAPRKVEVRAEFPWLVQESFTDVGK